VAASHTHEQTDALYRARAEVNLLFGKYERRVKKRAENITLAKMIDDPSSDPDEVGRAAFEQALKEERVLDAKPSKASGALNA
jgi:hypothetical protein